MTKWAFELSEELKTLVMIRSVTRMSHASGNVKYGRLPEKVSHASFKFDGPLPGFADGARDQFPG